VLKQGSPVAEYDTRAANGLPIVTDVLGDVAPGGDAIGLRIQRSELGPVELYLRVEDVQHIVSIMLVLCGEAQRRRPVESDAPPAGAVPVPLSAINIGQDDQRQTYMMLEVGAASLMFGLPHEVLADVGRTLLALSAQEPDKPS
jgi:hypothetical protein